MKISVFATSTLLWFFNLTNAQRKEFQSRIVGGDEASVGEFPFIVSWHFDGYLNDYPDCGGSLVAPNLVLTAAHCQGIDGDVRVGSLNAKSLYGGSPSGVEAKVQSEIMHPNYDASTTANDYMLLELDRNIDTAIYPPVNLNFDSTKPSPGEMLTVIGFGRIEQGGEQPDKLLKVDVPVVSHATCNQQYSGGIVQDIMICAGFTEGGKDSCQGDSGGPIFKKINGVTTQVGVVSFGIGCALPNYSGVYARTSGVSAWLKDNICSRSSSPKPLYCDGSEPTPSPPPADAPTPDNSPSSAPDDCTDSPMDWHDSDGTEFDCLWYAQGSNCEEHGDMYENRGKTANEACCSCGGGDNGNSQPVESPVLAPSASPESGNWREILYNNFEGNNWGEFKGKKLVVVDDSWSARLTKRQNIRSHWVTDIADYSELSVDFYFKFKGMESSDKFIAEFRFNGANDWTEAGKWSSSDFQNNQWNEATASMSIPPSATKVKVRFRCHADARGDILYIDDVALFAK